MHSTFAFLPLSGQLTRDENQNKLLIKLSRGCTTRVEPATPNTLGVNKTLKENQDEH